MTAKPWVVVAVMAMMCLMPYQSIDIDYLNSDYETKESGPGSAEILLMGNSYVASNSLHNLVDGVMNAASTPANVSTLNGGGMKLSQHASNVATSGHQWNTTLNNGLWDWVVLQDQSQVPGFPRTNQEWINSKDGAVELAEVIEDNGGETILMMTWGRRAGDSNNAWRFPDFSTMQDELASGYLDYRDNITANGDTAWVAPVGLAFEHIHDKIVAEGGTPTDSGNTFYNLYTGDGSHPSLSGSYLAAVVIYATITGNDPVGLSHTTTLSNGLVLELQQAAAATVFNETSHLDYPWQLQNQLPPINLSAIPDGALAWEWVEQFGRTSDGMEISDVTVDHNGIIYALGKSEGELQGNFSLGNCEFPQEMTMFVMKLQPDRSCSWVADVTTSQGGVMHGLEATSIAHDLQGNLYVTGYIHGGSSSKTYYFNDNTSNSISFQPTSDVDGIVAKINSQGEWQWLNNYSDQIITSAGVISQNQIVMSGYIDLGSNGQWYGIGTWTKVPFVRSIDNSGVESWYATVNVGTGCNGSCYQYTMSFDDLSIDSNDDILSLIHISEPTRRTPISYAVFCLKKVG